MSSDAFNSVTTKMPALRDAEQINYASIPAAKAGTCEYK
jgi:hypothetical protein